MNNNQVNEPETVLFEIEDKIATITLNRPKKMNSLRLEEFKLIIHHIKIADNDPDVHVIRIRSAGDRAFSGGLDLNMIQKITPEEIQTLLHLGNSTVRTMLQAKKPIVTQVQGPAVAWGAILCLSSDFVIAGDNPKTFFSLPEIDIELFPATGALTTTLFNVGFRWAKKVLMIPEKITLNIAEQLGLVTKRCSLNSLEETSKEFCGNLAAKSQNILIPIKALINNFHLELLESYFSKEQEAFNLFMSGDQQKFDDFVKRLWKSE
ncbi:MAG: enoyl-CoA hydratase/isomerase family protein [Candidatus Hodarchaeales archaeon]|jgi:enoyl-CoA hydratase/carnithine racemase